MTSTMPVSPRPERQGDTGRLRAVEAAYQVTVLPAGVEFDCGKDETILDAAVRNHLALPYGCRKGNCGTCKAQVLEGDVDLEVVSTYSLSDFERAQGFTLLCSAYACSDVTVEMEGLQPDDLEWLSDPVEGSAVLTSVESLTEDIRGVRLALEEPFPFRAGQFAQLEVPGTGVWRSYSMANRPSETSSLDFVIKLVPGGAFSAFLAEAQPGQRLRFRGPYGSFWVRDRIRPLLMIGGGAGMAPLWGMLQHLTQQQDKRPVRFYYGARTGRDLFYLDEIAEVGARLADFAFTPVLSEAGPTDAPSLARGMVTDVVEQHLGRDIARYDAYLCGPPPMIDAALPLLESHGLQERDHVFYDKFTAS